MIEEHSARELERDKKLQGLRNQNAILLGEKKKWDMMENSTMFSMYSCGTNGDNLGDQLSKENQRLLEELSQLRNEKNILEDDSRHLRKQLEEKVNKIFTHSLEIAKQKNIAKNANYERNNELKENLEELKDCRLEVSNCKRKNQKLKNELDFLKKNFDNLSNLRNTEVKEHTNSEKIYKSNEHNLNKKIQKLVRQVNILKMQSRTLKNRRGSSKIEELQVTSDKYPNHFKTYHKERLTSKEQSWNQNDYLGQMEMNQGNEGDHSTEKRKYNRSKELSGRRRTKNIRTWSEIS